MNKNRFLVLIALFFFGISGFVSAQNKVVAEKNRDKVDFIINGKLFTSYIFSENEKYPFFFPVNGPSDASVTSMRNANYPHHSSLFFGCDLVNGGNYWQEGIERGQIISLRVDIKETGGDKAIIENECIWIRPGVDAPIKDKRTISVSKSANGNVQLDFEIAMEMLQDVTINKTNHSLFSARMDPDLAVTMGGTMINAESETGEKDTFGKRSPWMDCYGKRGENIEGLAILQHPTNPWYPAPWFTRDYGFFSPTPMFWPENDKSTFIKKGEILNLKYRVLVHSGNQIDAKIAQEFDKYKSE